jgi:glycosyltransferase involved in cell wall biosynthesis
MDQCIVSCLVCKKPRLGTLPIHCSCGNVIGRQAPIIYTPYIRPQKRSDLCSGCEYNQNRTCKLFIRNKAKQGIAVTGGLSYLDTHLYTRCPKPSPPWFVGSVGFLSTSYMDIGGTETFHRILLPRLKNVAGFVSINKGLSIGDFSLLNTQYGVGMDAARALARDCQVLVVWGIGAGLKDILGERRPKVISISHCDARSSWTCNYMAEQEPLTDHFVYINKQGKNTVPIHRQQDSTLIPNGIPNITPATNLRSKYNIPQEAKVGVMLTRYSEEKRILEAMQAVRQTNHYLLIVGNASSSNQEYYNRIHKLQTNRVRLLPATPPGDILPIADYYLSLSKYEGFGLSLAEAMSLGVQVISTPVGLVEDEPQAAHLLPIDPSISDIINAISFPRNTRKAAYEVVARYGVDVFVERWQTLLNSFSASTSLPVRASCNGR